MATPTNPRIGVYVCHCGGNISDVIEVERVAKLAASLPNVVVARANTFLCSDAGQSSMQADIRELHLDRVVVAACSPKLHERTFRQVLDRAALNPYLYEHVNIREQVSWATHDHSQATCKAGALVAAGVAKAARLSALQPIRLETKPRAVVVGGGVAGLRAASDLARVGIEVTLIERQQALGGGLATLDLLFPNEERAANVLARLVAEVQAEPRITVHTAATVEAVSGYVGNFTVTVRQQPDGETRHGATSGDSGRSIPSDAAGSESNPDVRRITIEAGAIVVATGFNHYVPAKGEYGYGRLPQVITLPDFNRWLSKLAPGEGLPELDGRTIGSVAFIHCVGSRQVDGASKPQADGKINEYCSRVCCTATLQAICELHAKRPGVATIDFYQDIRTYGRGHEDYYVRASKAGTLFVRYQGSQPPTVRKAGASEARPVLVCCKDGLTWNEDVEVAVDLVVLSVGMMPADVSTLIDGLKLPVGTDRFLLEVHPKLRPVELAVSGVVVAGTCQGPKDVGETAASASAAAAKVAALLSKGYVELDPFVAQVNAAACTGSGLCVAECVYPGALALREDDAGRRHAVVNPALCVGCGACVAVCPSRAINLGGWTLGQYDAMVDALLSESTEVGR